MTVGEGGYRYYPRITRAYEDAWSKRAAEAKYVSTGSRLIWEYTSTTPGPKLFRYLPQDTGGNLIPQHKAVSDVFGHIQYSLTRLAKNHKDYDFPGLTEILTKESFAIPSGDFLFRQALFRTCKSQVASTTVTSVPFFA